MTAPTTDVDTLLARAREGDQQAVAELFSGWSGAGARAVSWDGTLGDGRLAGAGVYWVRLRARGEVRSLRFVALR